MPAVQDDSPVPGIDVAEPDSKVVALPAPRPCPAATLAECVPWLEIAVELIESGPDGLSIEAVERYRLNLIEIIEHIRPVVAREAKVSH